MLNKEITPPKIGGVIGRGWGIRFAFSSLTKIIVSPSSSRRQATVHRTVAFRWVWTPQVHYIMKSLLSQGWNLLCRWNPLSRMKLNPPTASRDFIRPKGGFHHQRWFHPPARVDLVEKNGNRITITVLFWQRMRDSICIFVFDKNNCVAAVEPAASNSPPDCCF